MRTIGFDLRAGLPRHFATQRRRSALATERNANRVRSLKRFPRFPSWIFFALILWLAPCAAPDVQAATEVTHDASLADLLREHKLHAYAGMALPATLPTPAQLRRFAEALRALNTHREDADPRALDRAQGLLRSVNYRLVSAADGYWYLCDRLPGRNWGAYAVNRAPRDRLLIAVPRPLGEAHALEAGLALAYETGAQAFAVAGAAGADERAEAIPRHSFFHAFHRVYAREDVLAVRSAALDIAGRRARMPVGASRLWVNRKSPASLELGRLRSRVGALVVIGKAAPGTDLQRDLASRAYAELQLNRDDAARLVATLEAHASMPSRWRAQAVKARLEDWLKAGTSPHAVPAIAAGSFEQEILRPLMRLAGTGYARGKWSPGANAQMRALHYLAAGIGYGITRLREAQGSPEYVVLHPARAQAGYARYVMRAGGGDDYAVSIPLAAQEPQALEYGLKMFRALRARMLASGTDLPSPAVLRERDGGDSAAQASMIIVSRSLSPASVPETDVLLAFADGTTSRGNATPLADRLVSAVRSTGRSYRFADAVAYTPANASAHSEIATLWLASPPRAVPSEPHREPWLVGQPAMAIQRALPPDRLAGIDAAPEFAASVR